MNGIHLTCNAAFAANFGMTVAQIIGTDDSWKCAYGPWREADLLQGSAYDARKGIPGWDEANAHAAYYANREIFRPARNAAL